MRKLLLNQLLFIGLIILRGSSLASNAQIPLEEERLLSEICNEFKNKHPQIFKEILSLSAKNNRLKKFILGLKEVKTEDKEDNAILREVLWCAANDAKLHEKQLRKSHPNICKRCNLLGIADENTQQPKIIYTLMGGHLFEMLFPKNGDYDIVTIQLDEHPDKWELKKAGDQTFIITSRMMRTSSEDLFQKEEIQHILVDGIQLRLFKTEERKHSLSK